MYHHDTGYLCDIAQVNTQPAWGLLDWSCRYSLSRRRTLGKVEPSLGTLGVLADTLGIGVVGRGRFAMDNTVLVRESRVKVACWEWEMLGTSCERGMGSLHSSLEPCPCPGVFHFPCSCGIMYSVIVLW